MPEAVSYINHGGQNSIMTGLMYGVPQIICPGNNFERRYNATSISNLKAGILLEPGNFNAETIMRIINDFSENPSYMLNSKEAGEHLSCLGGAEKAVTVLENLLK